MTNTITLTEEELFKYETITKLIGGSISIGQAREQLGLSVRQVKRLKRRVADHGAGGVAHGLRGKPGNKRMAQRTADEASSLLKEKYADFKPTFAAEKLKLHGISMSKEKARRLMVALGLWKQKKKKGSGQYRSWRPRKEWFGQLEQFDGSYHRWFEDRAEECCLLASIDDAKGTITRAEFGESESVVEVASFWKGYAIESGKPQAIYLDKYSTYSPRKTKLPICFLKNQDFARISGKPMSDFVLRGLYKINHKNAKDNQELMTQFQRMMREIGIDLITAHSPEAKGRIERLFRTLQDRLVKELRLAGISNIPDANKFLKGVFIPAFNAKFGVVAAREGDLHRPLAKTEKENLDAIFSVQHPRTVRSDFTIQFENQWLQLEKVQPCTVLRNDAVIIERRLDGTLHARLRGKYLAFKVLPARPEKDAGRITALVPRKPWKPPEGHPWRKPFLPPDRQV